MTEPTTSTDAPPSDDPVAEVARLADELAGTAPGPTRDELEQRLPYVRLDAAAALAGTPGRPDWPPTVDDPFPEVSGRLPEIGPSEITTDVLAGGILHHGAVVVRGLLGPQDVTRIRSAMDEARDARSRAQADPPEGDGAPAFVPFRPKKKTAGQKGKPHLVRLVDAPRVLTDVLATYHRLGLIDAAAGYFGEPAVLTANKSVLRYLEVPRMIPTDFHQDGRFMGAETRAANVWVTLDDCGTTAPGLDVVPRREPRIHPTGNGDNGFDWTLSQGEVEAMAGDVGIHRLDLRAGDGLLFDHFLVHRSAHDRAMTQMRHAVECWLFAASHAPPPYQPLLT